MNNNSDDILLNIKSLENEYELLLQKYKQTYNTYILNVDNLLDTEQKLNQKIILLKNEEEKIKNISNQHFVEGITYNTTKIMLNNTIFMLYIFLLSFMIIIFFLIKMYNPKIIFSNIYIILFIIIVFYILKLTFISFILMFILGLYVLYNL